MMKNKVYIHANLITMDPALPDANAFSIIDGKFNLVGDESFVMENAGPDPEIIDLKNQVVFPGFIETHNHLSYYSLTRLMADCSYFDNVGIPDVLKKIKDLASSAADTDQVIKGWGYDDTMIAENRHLTRQDLDEVSPDNPVFISHTSAHLAYVNSKALSMGGITKDTPQPAGGKIHMDENGEPSGLLMEPAAISMVEGHFPKPETSTFIEALPAAMRDFNKTGVTSAHDAAIGIFGSGPGTMEAYRSLERSGDLSVRVYLTILAGYYDPFLDGGIRNGFGSDFLKFGSVKILQDGSIQAWTAALEDDYIEKPGFKGDLIHPQEELDSLIEKYQAMGMQIAVHANGDRTIESVITAFERANEKYPDTGLRHMIIHCQLATDDHIQRMKRLGIIPNYFVSHVYFWGDRHVERFIGPERAARIDPLGSTVKAGLKLALHRDTPVTAISPLGCIHDAVNRETMNGMILGKAERISPLDAVKAFTTDAAYCSFEENIKGSITPGKLGDFVVLSDNPLTVSPKSIKDIEVLQTVTGGRLVYEKGITEA